MLQDLRRDEHELLARIAYRYYEDGRSQEEIAHEFGLSRPKVQRLLERARSSGVVDIHIEVPAGLNLELEKQLIDTFQPDRRDRRPGRDDPDVAARGRRQERGAGTSSAASSTGPWSRSATAVTSARCRDSSARQRRVDCIFASAMGGSPHVDAPTSPNEICRALAEKSGGRAASLYAPAYVESSRGARQLAATRRPCARPSIWQRRAGMALVGIGGVDDGCTMVRSGCLSLAEIARLRDQGAVGRHLGQLRRPRGRGHRRRPTATG